MHGGRLVYFGESATSDYWDDQWSSETQYERQLAGHIPHQLRKAVRMLPPGGRVLEAGCGQGHFTVAMAANGFRAEGVDWAPRTVDRLTLTFPSIRFFIGDVRSMDVADDTYDAVYSPGVCEHFIDGPGPVLAETARVLRPGGLAIITAPTFNPLRQSLARRGRFSKPVQGDFYQYAFGRSELEEAIGIAGMTPVAFSTFNTMMTLRDHFPVPRLQGVVGQALYVTLDNAPITRRWGHIGLWLARAR